MTHEQAPRPGDPPASLGRCLRSHGTDDWVVFESRQDPGFVVHAHDHGRLSICAVIDGSYEAAGGGIWQAGDMVVAPAGTSSALRFGPRGAHCLVIEIGDELWSGPRNVAPPERARREKEPDLWSSVARLRSELAWSSLAPEHGLVEEALLELTDRLVSPGAQEEAFDSPLSRAVALVRDGYRDGISLAVVARELGLHRATLARRFRAAFGLSLGQYVQRLRIAQACRMLHAGRALAEVALECGFADQSHLSRVFRRQIGRAPGEYRGLERVPAPIVQDGWSGED